MSRFAFYFNWYFRWHFLRYFLKGVGLIAPIVILYTLFDYLYDGVSEFISPIVGPVISHIAGFIYRYMPFIDQTHTVDTISMHLANLSVFMFIAIAFYTVGFIASTRIGKFFILPIKRKILYSIPGYQLIKGVIETFTNIEKSPLKTFLLYDEYGDKSKLIPAFLAAVDSEQYSRIFCPTAPNPTSGFPFIVINSRLLGVDMSVQEAMKIVVGCGAGEESIIEKTTGLLDINKYK